MHDALDAAPLRRGKPVVAVASTKFISGINDLDTPGAEALLILPFEDAFSTPYKTDAHFVAYQPSFAGLDAWPRLNKPVLTKMRHIGCDIVSNLLVLDYDNPDHTAWLQGQWGEFLRQLSDLADSWPMAWQWSLLYATKNGARLVYVLDEPLPVDAFELRSLWMCQEFTSRGIAIPDECCDWTRLFRLPFVTRDGKPTWEEDYAEILHQDVYLETAKLGQSTRRKKSASAPEQEYREIVPVDRPQPKDDFCERILVYVNEKGRRTPTLWAKEARKFLKGRECYPCCFEHALIAEEGARNSTIVEYVGQAIGMLMPGYNNRGEPIGVLGTRPEHIYALFIGAIDQLDSDDQTADWSAVLWDAICRLWALEAAKVSAGPKKSEEEAAQEIKTKATLAMIIEGMKKWCSAAELYSSSEEVRTAWASQHLIVSTGTNFMIIQPNGYYDPMQITQTQLVARLNIVGIGGTVIQTQELGQNRAIRPVGSQQIINDHCTIVTNIRAMPEIDGAFIENVDSPLAQVVMPAYQRSKRLKGEYNEDVDTWLKKLFGENYEIGTKWLAWSLAWDEGPICALSIAGKAGSGKKMLVQGLAECLRLPKLATTEDLVGNYGYGLFQSPFLVVNEGWPANFNGMHPADKFRALVSGDMPPIRKMYRDPIDVRSPVRIVFTANNLDVVKMLSANKDLSPDDRDALSIRLLHMNITEDAKDWLAARGGTQLTAVPGKRWIAGDNGAESDYVVAKHFLWLYERRKGPVGVRFLVEGGNSQKIMFDMRTGSGNTPLVIETIIRLLETPSRHKGIAIEDGELYVTHDAVLNFFREEIGKDTRQTLTGGAVTTVLRGLVKSETHYAKELASRPELGKKYWQNIDAMLLLKVAQQNGTPSKRLEALVQEQEARGKGVFTEEPMVLAQRPTQDKISNVLNFAAMFEKKGAV